MKRAFAPVVVLLALAGCTSISLKGRNVQRTTFAGDVKECKHVGEVQMGTMGPLSDSNRPRNEAAGMGGDVIHVEGKVGHVFNCGGKYKAK